MAGIERTVLVVDDSGSVLHSLRLLLESARYRSAGFGSAEEPIESGLVENACCLILDIKLPGMSGFELQEYLTASHTAIPVIFITGHDRPGMEEQALRLGAVAYLRKPFDGQAILEAIKPCCGKGGGETTP
jgi:FixJ family two-component response regulator